MISHKYKCIFIHIPKCAGTSIETVFGHLDNYSGRGGQDHRSIRMLEQPLITKNTLSSQENISELIRRIRYQYTTQRNPRNKITLTREQYHSYYKFTFIRNPWARAYSWYENVMRDNTHKQKSQITEPIPFNEFLRIFSGKGMLKPQTYWLKDFSGSIPLNYIGRFENLAEDFQAICKEMNIPTLSLPHKVAGSGKDYHQSYSQESIDLIKEVYREEIEMFQYSFEDSSVSGSFSSSI